MTLRPRRLLDDCFLHDKERLRHDDALALILERTPAVVAAESVMLAEATGRILAETVTAPRDVPAFANAAVDGYAVCADNLTADAATRLPVSARIAAGDLDVAPLRPRTAVRIFTGARLPEGADTVVMQEDVSASDDTVTIPPGVRPGVNARNRGEDVAAGTPVAEAGMRLRPQEIAAIASTGAERTSCYERLRVALVSTGDEIVRPGRPLAAGQVYDSNSFLLRALLRTVDAEASDLGILPDDEATVRRTVADATATVHVILSTGGASRGEEDHVVETIRRLGKLHAWQLAVKPGRPLAFGQIGDTVFLGLPGNPVAVFVCFLLYAQPLFAHLQGARWTPPRRYFLPAGFDIAKKKPDRREFLRGWIEDTAAGPALRKFPRDGSGLISGLRAADGLIEIPEETTRVREGDLVGYIPLTEFGLPPR